MAQARLSGLFAERYLIERELGHGASAVVYLAQDTKHDRAIALKVLSKDLAHALGPQRFLREIHLTSRLHHPHILPIYDSGESNGLLYYVLPFVRGESLRDRINREKQLPIEECVRITCELADALAHAHAAGVIHRDVKPENVMLSDGHALLSDFGIARTLDVHTGERLTSSGLIVGTSAYMSPEQASGEEHIDVRSDIYSLACVLYEMIAGLQPFIGPTTQAVIAQRFTHTPRPVSTYRPAVPEHLEAVLEKALAVAPADRFQTVKEFAAELSGAPSASRDRRRSPLRRAVFGRQKAFGFAAVAVVIATAAFMVANPPGHWRSMFGGGATLDSTKYVVIPYDANGRVAVADIDAAMGIHRALSKWRGISLVDPAAVGDAVKSRPALPVGDAFGLAKKYGAGKMIRVNSLLDATLYDVSSGATISEVSGDELKRTGEPYPLAVVALLRVSNRPKSADGGDGRTSSLPAWQAYGRAHAALRRRDFAGAREQFAHAVRFDADFTPAVAWLAQVTEWIDSTASWRDDAAKAAASANHLEKTDSVLAIAIRDMASHRFPDACYAYQELTRSNPDAFVGWYGLGECREKDDAVLANPRSPSGWYFRSSSSAAAAAFEKALSLAPEAHSLLGFERMRGLLPVSSLRIRRGFGPAPSRQVFAAYPILEHDTLGFVPYPAGTFAMVLPSVYRTRREALKRNKQRLLQFAAEWTRIPPGSANAFEALATMLEEAGAVGDVRDPSTSAMGALRQAQQISRDSAQKFRLATLQVRLLFKQAAFEGAQQLADSLLRAGPRRSKSENGELAVVAGLVGRVRQMAQSAAEADIPSGLVGPSLPGGIKESAAKLFAYAALGVCGNATVEIENRLEQQLKSYSTDEERAAVRAAAETRALSMLAPCSNARSAMGIQVHNDRLYQAQQAFARREFATARALLDSIAMSRKDVLPGEVSFDHTYQNSWLRSALGDTARATSLLDLALEALPGLGASSLDDPAASAAVGRAMALRADIAQKRGDWQIARKWANALTLLWKDADPELQPVVARMRLAAKHQ